ncbi:putative neutral protease 2 precursor [Glonium stellatum]|uniref:Neutral protease 2 n=1 Tax=Glonium stellatum TaxID=574774 RepID=A0A8E2F8B5_9PEZI|nr:putative neutral protease 2 precursor [Glonium stellatum]
MRPLTQLLLAIFVTLVGSTAIDTNKRASPLAVSLTTSGNTEVKVAITNKGATALNLLSKGTILDESAPVEKVQIFSANTQIAFEGIRMRLLTSNLTQEFFTALAPGETKELTVETASLHTMDKSGVFDVFASGAIPYAEVGSTELIGTLSYASEKLSINVDGALASKVSKAISKRTILSSDCTGTKRTAVLNALSDCSSLAKAAASAAKAGTKITTYFKSSSAASTVAARLNAVAAECSSSSSGATTTHCADTYNGCSSNVLAYTVPSQNFIVYCDVYFSALPLLASSCHAQDQATTTIHENTHAPGVYSPGTQDYAYGFSSSTSLSASQALLNADTYALYANAIHLNC